MKLVCPHCAKVVEVAESLAGQATTCGFCRGSFTVPLAQPDFLPPPPPPAAPPPMPSAGPLSSGPAPIDPLGDEKPKAFETLPYPEKADPKKEAKPVYPAGGAAGAAKFDAIKEKLSGVAEKLPGKVVLRFDPSWLSWVAPIAMIVLFFLFFFTWQSFTVGGATLLSQSGFGIAFGSVSSAVPKLFESGTLTSSLNLMLFLVVLVGFLAAVGLIFNSFAPAELRAKAGPWPEPLRRHQRLIFAFCSTAALLLALFQALFGFPLLGDLTGQKADSVVATGLTAKLDGDWRLKAGAGEALAPDFVQRHFCWRLTVATTVVAAIAALITWFLDRRGLQGTPKLEIGWGVDSQADSLAASG